MLPDAAVILTNVLVREYLVNYARPLIYTTSLPHATVIAIDCVLDLMEDGTVHEVKPIPSRSFPRVKIRSQLSTKLLDLSAHFVSFLRPRLAALPPDVLSLPSHLTDNDTPLLPCPIIPLITSMPWSLSSHFLTLGINTSPITPPIVPTSRIRVSLHTDNTKEEIEKFAFGAIRWAEEVLAQQGRAKLKRKTVGAQETESGRVSSSASEIPSP